MDSLYFDRVMSLHLSSSYPHYFVYRGISPKTRISWMKCCVSTVHVGYLLGGGNRKNLSLQNDIPNYYKRQTPLNNMIVQLNLSQNYNCYLYYHTDDECYSKLLQETNTTQQVVILGPLCTAPRTVRGLFLVQY